MRFSVSFQVFIAEKLIFRNYGVVFLMFTFSEFWKKVQVCLAEGTSSREDDHSIKIQREVIRFLAKVPVLLFLLSGSCVNFLHVLVYPGNFFIS